MRIAYKRRRREIITLLFAEMFPTPRRSVAFVKNISKTVTKIMKIAPKRPKQIFLLRLRLPSFTFHFVNFPRHLLFLSQIELVHLPRLFASSYAKVRPFPQIYHLHGAKTEIAPSEL